METPFDRCIFVNCPFDDDFAPILQAIAFCAIYLGYFPKLAPENQDGGTARLDKIIDMIKSAKYGIHDLSLCKSSGANQYARMNMPFELGLDHACKRFGPDRLGEKAILILEQEQFDYQRSLSDIAGWDIHAHGGDHEKALKSVRNWLVAKPETIKSGAAKILGEYSAFQVWYWEREFALGAAEQDIREYPTIDVIRAMHEWNTTVRTN